MKKNLHIVGGGPSAMMLAATLDPEKFDVHIHEKNPAVARKFLVAGDGGFNLTHGESIGEMRLRYSPPHFLDACLEAFSNIHFREWLSSIGIETYEGSSKRVFPKKGIKPIEVLNAILQLLQQKGVHFHPQQTWQGWDEQGRLIFQTNDTLLKIKADLCVFALGGGSWKVTGSDGSWTPLFIKKGIHVLPFEPSNCAFQVAWKNSFLEQTEGTSLKNISLRCGELEKKGELVVTQFGLEGGAIYALSKEIRSQLHAAGKAEIVLDLKPMFSESEILDRFERRGNRSIRKMLADKLNLSETAIQLLLSVLSKEQFTDAYQLAAAIKKLPIELVGTASLDEAISTVGGIDLQEVDAHFELKKMPGNFCIGEMLDWDAPTGGYLLQACFSMGYYLAKELNRRP